MSLTDKQSLKNRLGHSARSAVSTALPIYRRMLPTEIRALIPESVRRAAKWTLGIKDPIVRVQELRLRLNDLGFVERALEDLTRMSKSAEEVERQLATWELAVWHANRRSEEGAAATLALLDKGLDAVAHAELRRREAVLRAECHATLCDVEAGRAVIAAALQEAEHPDLHLAAANLDTEPDARLEHINRALRFFALPEVSLLPNQGEDLYDRLSVAETLPPADGPKVTVIVPAFNASDHIATALEALIAQTWTNLEVLVVDDRSTDATAEIVSGFSERDPRIKLIWAPENRGSYVARNIALGEASGAFVTTHDSDDWSHPQKLEIQVRHLMSTTKAAANVSVQARATSALSFHRRGNPGHYIFDNMSSLMFRREAVLDRLGHWDSARFGADSEFIERIRRTFGRDSVVSLTESGPLSFQRQSESSLTGSSVFGFHGFFMGARLAYHQASRLHHRRGRGLRYDFPQDTRPFAIPEPMQPHREVAKGEQRRFETVLVADFRLRAEAARIRSEIEAERRQGHRIGLVQMAVYGADPNGQVLPAFRELEDRGDVHFIVAGERVKCDRLAVLNPRVLEHFQRFVPEVDTGHVEIIAGTAPDDVTTPEGAADWQAACQKTAERVFGTAGVWKLGNY